MATFSDTPPDFRPSDPRCSCCGEGGIAFWVGSQTIVICGKCATTVLPRLIADAVTADGPPTHIDVALNTVIKNFLGAAATALERQAGKSKSSSFESEE